MSIVYKDNFSWPEYSDPTAEEAIAHLENPSTNIEDLVLTSTKSVIKIGNAKLLGLSENTITQEELIAETELLINRKISRKTLSEWEEFGMVEKGVKEGKYKYYPGDAHHELYASWLLAKADDSLIKKCSLKEAGKIRRIVTDAVKKNIIEDSIIKFIEPGEVPSRSNPRWAPKAMSKEEMLTEGRIHSWLRYRILSQEGLDPLDSSYIIHYKKTTFFPSNRHKYEYEITNN